jgi:uncharacterized protein YcbK (DUF882 family)
MKRSLRLAALAITLVHVSAHGQTSARSPLLAHEGVSRASSSVGETAAEQGFKRFGLSGAVNAIVAAQAELAAASGAIAPHVTSWAGGHRWTPLFAESDRKLLGEPSYAAAAYSKDSLRTPGVAGIWRLESEAGEAIQVITQVPASAQQGEHLNGYRIGLYPTAESEREDAYVPPTAFIEVTGSNRDFAISQHIALGQFVTKDQFDVWPKYVALDFKLVDKLELVIQELNAMGIRAESIDVMSGFRTPQYNGPGGDGRASLSRHMWGDAADVWIDNDGNNEMDDLNGDGRIDLDDAAVIMEALERVEAKYPSLVGGAGTYPTTDTHGPFIHIDARGHRSRW